LDIRNLASIWQALLSTMADTARSESGTRGGQRSATSAVRACQPESRELAQFSRNRISSAEGPSIGCSPREDIMTTKLRTGLLLVFTAMTAGASLSGCLIETTSGPPQSTCAEKRFYEVYWNVAADMNSPNYTCPQTPAFSACRVGHHDGDLRGGQNSAVSHQYMGFELDWAGSTDSGIPAASSVAAAHLIAADGVTSCLTLRCWFAISGSELQFFDGRLPIDLN
jgi:hypothetical protein